MSPRAKTPLLLLALLVLAAAASGCAGTRYVKEREQPLNVLAGPLGLLGRGGPRPTPRTLQLLRRYDLVGRQKDQPQVALASLQKEIAADPSPDSICSYAELAYLEGQRLETAKNRAAALEYYGAAVAHAYWFLLDPNLDRFRNPYDPQFRRACDLYNASLEAAMRIVVAKQGLKPGETHVVQVGKKEFQIEVVPRGPWHPDDLARFEFVSDFEIEGGLTNHHHTYGLGVPLIAVRNKHDSADPAERYYPPGLCIPVTAFLRVEQQRSDQTADVHRCVLELYDPLYSSTIAVDGRLVPLETDLSTPLAYFLDSPAFREKDIATVGLLDPMHVEGIKGLYMVDPYDPNRIPVVMVHGLWSSPTTWMEMFNDLRAFPELRSRYQFWFFLYPSGQPFWTSAAQLRDALAEARQALDPAQRNPNLDQMVLVGHSMGGLVSKLQTVESGDDFWHILTDQPIEELKADPEDRARLAKAFYFHPSPSVKRVITIGTPHRGSDFANDYTRELSRRLITLPEMMLELSNKITRENPSYFRNTDLLTMNTSIDSLAPDCPIFPVLQNAQRGSGVHYHNVVGVVARKTWLGRVSESGDGIVAYESAHLDDVASELIVEADHLAVHRHPLAVLEVRRILNEHLGSIVGPAMFAAQPGAGIMR
jgi:pimeloyl-ACP methyl ester carboxylesterase